MQAFSVTLEARNPDRQHYRSYTVSASRDLFGAWIVEIRFGRIGCAGPLVTYSAADEIAARGKAECDEQRRQGQLEGFRVLHGHGSLQRSKSWGIT